ncbi:MAG TPA: glycosyltransferase [Solirubrobacteraceae bacterium]|nr:glycosyltransferase [Solirubrobacteraceae bacterium]
MSEPSSRASLRVAVVGASTEEVCGVRDHAQLQAGALAARGVECSTWWLQRTDASLAGSRAQVGAWTRELAGELRSGELDAVLLHYSVFSYAYRGFPVFVPGVLSALRASALPLVAVLHEFVYPWGRGGVRGTAWALTQRALLFEVMRASAGIVVTTSWRDEWLASRAWLPSRRTVVAPVFSNLPPADAGVQDHAAVPVVGLFGYAYEAHVIALVIDAMRSLERAGVDAQLLLIGAPGGDSQLARQWLAAGLAAGLAHEPSLSGMLSAQQLSNLLAGCTVLLSAEPSGPTSRKTTLAASLASGRPLVALDGRRTWAELQRADAALVVEPRADALADALAGLLADAQRRVALGVRGRTFAAHTMTAEHNAAQVAGLLAEVVR